MELQKRILLKADELFCKYGFRAITIDEICTALGISKKTLYQFFEDKDALVDAVMMAHFEKNHCECTQASINAKNAVDEIFIMMSRMDEQFRTLNPIVLHDLKKFHYKTFQKFEQHKQNNILQMIVVNLKRGIDEGIYRDDFNIEIVARFRMACIWIPFDTETFPTNKYSLAQVFHEVFELFLYGLVNTKGFKLIEKYKQKNQPKY